MMVCGNEAKGKSPFTLEEGRNDFADRMRKYQFDAASLEKLKDYYGYFWNRKNHENIPQLYKNIFLFCESDKVGRSIYEACAECLESQGLIARREEIGYTYLSTEQDINEIKEMYAEGAVRLPKIAAKRERFQSVIAAMTDAGEAKAELYRAGTSLFYREFRDHITSKAPESKVVYWELCRLLEKEQQFTQEFYEALENYIQTVYPKREIESIQRFLQDACDRIRNKYYGRYQAGAIGGVDCVPDYQKNPEPVAAKEDINEEDLNAEICNVLLLNMSTYPRGNKLGRNQYQYVEKEACYDVFGCGQLEPVPKMLDKKLRMLNERLDLILIMASEETKKEEIIEVEEESPDLESKKRWIAKAGSAVDFFKEQIGKEIAPIQFKVFSCDDDNLTTSLGDVVAFIRKIKNYNPEFKLYLDIHGGLRQAQLSIDAIINLLSMEDIHIEDAFSIAGVRTVQCPTQITNVTKDMRIFDFVSGMNEFINYGRSKGLEDFFGRKNTVVNNIKSISRAIQICDIDRFLAALDRMRHNIQKVVNNEKDTDQKLLNIFIENMRQDYGNLLAESRTDLDLLKWCGRKRFYQQALTVIESRIPEFLEGKVYEFHVKLRTEGSEDRSREEILKGIKPRDWEKDCNYLLEQWCYRKLIKKEGRFHSVYMRLDKKGAQQYWDEKNEYWSGDHSKKYEFYLSSKKNRRDEAPENCCDVELRFLHNLKQEDVRRFNIFMQLHMALKNQRNLVNHAVSKDENREEPGNIFNAIEAYIEMVEYFIGRVSCT